MNKENKKTLIRNTIFGIMILGILVYFSIKYTPSIIKLLNNTDEFRKYVLSYGKMGILVFSIFQFSQILIPIILFLLKLGKMMLTILNYLNYNNFLKKLKMSNLFSVITYDN